MACNSNIATKIEQIQMWNHHIEKLDNQIMQLQSDPNISDEKRHADIARRQNIIRNQLATIQRVQDFIDQQNWLSQYLRDKYLREK